MSKLSRECGTLIEELGLELVTIKDQLSHLTQSLNEGLVVRPPPTLRVPPNPKPPSATEPSEDVPVWSEEVTIVPRPATPSSSSSPTITPPESLSKRKRKHTRPTMPTICVASQPPETTRHLLGVVDKREALRSEARDRYLQLMRTHIDKQLENVAQQEKLFERKREVREKRQKAAKRQMRPARHRSSGLDDKVYLENVYQGYLYKIIEVEHSLRKCGKLKTIRELKAFWDEMLSPLHSPAPCSQPRPSTSSSEHELQTIEEEGGCTNSWAITADNLQLNRKAGDRLPSVCPSTIPTPLRFTPSHLPDLIPLREILDKNSEETMLKIRDSLKEYDGVMNKQRARIHRVYQKAKANEIAMRTLLSSSASPCFVLSDSLAISTAKKASPQHSATQHPATQPHLTLPCLDRQTASVSHSAGSSIPSVAHASDDSCLKVSSVEPIKKLSVVLHPLSKASTESVLSVGGVSSHSKPICVPLTMSELLKEAPVIKECATKNMMWNNYQLAGK